MPRAPKNYLRGNPKIPWEEYETQVRDALASTSGDVKLSVQGKRVLQAGDAEYEVDAYAEIEMFGGALFKVIVECKRHARPVTRDMVLALHAKTLALGAHKAMMFSTSGFQKGAVAYAKKHGISLVKLAKRRITYAVGCFAPPVFVVRDSSPPTFIAPCPPPVHNGIQGDAEQTPSIEAAPACDPPLVETDDNLPFVGVLVSASDPSDTLSDWLQASTR